MSRKDEIIEAVWNLAHEVDSLPDEERDRLCRWSTGSRFSRMRRLRLCLSRPFVTGRCTPRCPHPRDANPGLASAFDAGQAH